MERCIPRPAPGEAVLALVLLVGALVGLPPTAADAAIPYPDATRIDANGAVSAGIAVSRQLFDDGAAGAAILTRDDTFPDGLAAAAVAGAKNAPVLFTPTDRLDSRTRSELERVLPSGGRVYLMGGPMALSPAVQDAVEDAGYRVTRLNGQTRIHTAAIAAEYYVGSTSRTAVLVRGFGKPGADATQGWVDAVSCGGYAAATTTPILLTDTNQDQLPQRTVEALQRLDIERVEICGGFDAVPQSHTNHLAQLGIASARYAGGTRVTTAVDVAKRLWGKGGSTDGDRFVLVHGFGTNFAYGIAAAPLSGATDSPILLVDSDEPATWPVDCGDLPNTPSATLCYLHGDGDDRVASLTLVAGESVVTDQVFDAAARAAGLRRDTAPPSVPSAVEAVDRPEDDGTALLVTWDASTDDSGGDITYTIYAREASEEPFTTGDASSAGTVRNGTSFILTGRTPGTEYQVALTASDSFGRTSELSEPAAGTPTDEVPDAPRDAPNLQPGTGSVTVGWIEAPEADAAGYLIERAAPGLDNPLTLDEDESCEEMWGASYAEVARIDDPGITSYRDTGVESGERYCYRYRVFDTTYDPGSHAASGPSPTATTTVG